MYALSDKAFSQKRNVLPFLKKHTNKSSVEGLCEKSASLIRWSSVNRKYDIPAFCKGIIKKGRDYEPTLLELKSLLTEHAMRQVLNDDARQTLKAAISTMLNRCF